MKKTRWLGTTLFSSFGGQIWSPFLSIFQPFFKGASFLHLVLYMWFAISSTLSVSWATWQTELSSQKALPTVLSKKMVFLWLRKYELTCTDLCFMFDFGLENIFVYDPTFGTLITQVGQVGRYWIAGTFDSTSLLWPRDNFPILSCSLTPGRRARPEILVYFEASTVWNKFKIKIWFISCDSNNCYFRIWSAFEAEKAI